MVQCCPKNRVDPRIRWIPMVDHHISSLSPDSPVKLPSIGGPLMLTAAPRRCTKASHDTRTALLQETRPPKPGFQALSRTSLFSIILSIILNSSASFSQFCSIIPKFPRTGAVFQRCSTAPTWSTNRPFPASSPGRGSVGLFHQSLLWFVEQWDDLPWKWLLYVSVSIYYSIYWSRF